MQGEVAAAAGCLGSQLAELGLGRLLGRKRLLQAAAEDAHRALVGLVLGLHLLLCAGEVRTQALHLLLLLGDGPGAGRRKEVSAHLNSHATPSKHEHMCIQAPCLQGSAGRLSRLHPVQICLPRMWLAGAPEEPSTRFQLPRSPFGAV